MLLKAEINDTKDGYSVECTTIIKIQYHASAQISLAVWTTKLSLFQTSSSVTGLPSACDAKPHCGLIHILEAIIRELRTGIEFVKTHWFNASSKLRFSSPSAMTLAASLTFCFNSSLSSS